MRWLPVVISAIPFGEDFLCQVTSLGGKGREGQEFGYEVLPCYSVGQASGMEEK